MRNWNIDADSKHVLEDAGCKIAVPIQQERMPDPGVTPGSVPPTATPDPRANPLRRAG
ncbi:hypothetical protein LMG31506_03291 [Cupriavidus yeoncheonensis]|uniref:Uncharacterized protein n=1 Tax=Cupriavidus yeoncheonensis TaxID=1462994 RepID=A0A916N4E3_9BURK|nr:hypothetical protein [Cupriavidus yeoncheonensis]CAG2145941.1 hypothetical protein LMG31506_03291 [Cupriavidus yeoncheonensis]